MTFKIIETFSGIGAQAKAFERLKKRIPNLDYEVVATVEWEIGATYAYDIIHKGEQDLTKYKEWSKEDLVKCLSKLNLSSDGKKPMTTKSIERMNLEQLKAIKHSIDGNKNLVDISCVHASDLPDADLLTYSFPCQDLSVSSYWHRNFSGIDKSVQNRSGLLWEIERILNEYQVIGKSKPRFLLMENVSAIHGPLHVQNFNMWITELRDLGYKSYYFDLDAKNFGVPQSRVRTFMISILTEDLSPHQKNNISIYFDNTKLLDINEPPSLEKFLCLDYKHELYLNEALESIPNNTDSRKKIYRDSLKLARGKEVKKRLTKTITTKQDRNPNAGIVIHGLDLGKEKAEYRNLTPRETFLLMGFDENDFQALIDNNLKITKSRNFLSRSKLLKLSGNSIVVNILEEIFFELIQMNETIIHPADNILPIRRNRI